MVATYTEMVLPATLFVFAIWSFAGTWQFMVIWMKRMGKYFTSSDYIYNYK